MYLLGEKSFFNSFSLRTRSNGNRMSYCKRTWPVFPHTEIVATPHFWLATYWAWFMAWIALRQHALYLSSLK